MTPTDDSVATAFLAAAESAGLKKVFVLVGKIGDDAFVVTMSVRNPASLGEDDECLASCRPYEFEDAAQVREAAAAKARMFARSIPTIH